jgi:hypothetical protein
MRNTIMLFPLMMSVVGCSLEAQDPSLQEAACDELSQQVYESQDVGLPSLTAEMADRDCYAPEVTDHLGELAVERASIDANSLDTESVAQGFYNLAQLEPDRFPMERAPKVDTDNVAKQDVTVVIVGNGGKCVRYYYGDSVLLVCGNPT